MRANYVFIDFENVQPEALSLLDAEHFKVKVFVSINQNKIAFETALVALQRCNDKVEAVKIAAGNASNALDFHILRTTLEGISAEDPTYLFPRNLEGHGIRPADSAFEEDQKIFRLPIKAMSQTYLY